MEKFAKNYVEKFMDELVAKNPGEAEFIRAVHLDTPLTVLVDGHNGRAIVK